MAKSTDLQALLFDVDGTLADTEGQGHLPAFNAAFEAFGLPHRWDEASYRKLLAQVPGGRERIEYALAQQPPPERYPDRGQLARDLHDFKNRNYAERLTTGAIRPRPGTERIIRDAVAQGLRVAIVTTSARANVAALLDHVLTETPCHAFALMVCGEDVRTKKPDPEAYQAALQTLALPASACLAFEDSANGLRAARAAGIPTVVTPTKWTRHENFAGAAAIFEHLDKAGDGRPVDLDALRALHGDAAP